MESTTMQQKSGGKVRSDDSHKPPKQNSRKNLNDSATGGKNQGSGLGSTGYTRESM